MIFAEWNALVDLVMSGGEVILLIRNSGLSIKSGVPDRHRLDGQRCIQVE